jgi:glycine/D-amino acid oxidase-like deaminating enzyme
VAVIGAGAFGGWTAFHLQRRGARVALLDAWGAGHPRGTSSGDTRIIRFTYGAKSLYTDWSWRARQLWLEWERQWRVPLFIPSGVLWLWKEENEYFRESVAALQRRRIPIERLHGAEFSRRFPQISHHGVAFVTFEPDGGFLRARLATEAVQAQVAEHGGDVRIAAVAPPRGPGPRLKRLFFSDGPASAIAASGKPHAGKPNNQEIAADVFIFACGPWLPQIFPQLLHARLAITRQDVFYFGVPAGDLRYSPPAMPAWCEYESEFYGIPACNGGGFKLANNQGVAGFDPTNGERVADPRNLEDARRYLARRFPGLAGAPLVETSVCQYERTPDSHLVMDRHPLYENVWIVGGGSGHGFKLGPAVGEFLAGVVRADDRERIPAELRLGASAFPETGALPAKAAF